MLPTEESRHRQALGSHPPAQYNTWLFQECVLEKSGAFPSLFRGRVTILPKPRPGKVPKKCFGKCPSETGCRGKCRKKCSESCPLCYLCIGAEPKAPFWALSSAPRFGPALSRSTFPALFLAGASALLEMAARIAIPGRAFHEHGSKPRKSGMCFVHTVRVSAVEFV